MPFKISRVSLVGLLRVKNLDALCCLSLILNGLVRIKTPAFEHNWFSFLSFSQALTPKSFTIGNKSSILVIFSEKLLLTTICFFGSKLLSHCKHVSPLSSLTVLSKTTLYLLLIKLISMHARAYAVLRPNILRSKNSIWSSMHRY